MSYGEIHRHLKCTVKQWQLWDLQFGGQWGGHVFSWGSQNYNYRSDGSRICQEVWGTISPPEAEAFLLNYTSIFDFLSMIYDINLT